MSIYALFVRIGRGRWLLIHALILLVLILTNGVTYGWDHALFLFSGFMLGIGTAFTYASFDRIEGRK